MRHLKDELLAGLALGEPDALPPAARRHLLGCRNCAARLGELRTIVGTGTSAPPYPLRAPRPGLLADVQAELRGDVGPRTANDVGDEVPTEATGAGRLPHRAARFGPAQQARWLVAAAAVVALVVGGTVWYRSAEHDVIATATLDPLPDHAGRGTAQLFRGRGGQQLSVSATTTLPADRFEELWLINTDGRRMIAVGILPPDGRASFPVPSAGAALAGYTIVDISLEPFDGNAAHSHNSVLRGTLG